MAARALRVSLGDMSRRLKRGNCDAAAYSLVAAATFAGQLYVSREHGHTARRYGKKPYYSAVPHAVEKARRRFVKACAR